MILIEKLKKNKYTIEQKLKVLEEIKTNSIYIFAKKYDIDRNSIKDWRKQVEELRIQINYKKYRKLNLPLTSCN